jgi:EmrB/QacA subfamily drug resistance transporter
MGAVLVGTFMVSLDQTIVTIGLPAMGEDLGVTSGLDWVVTAYFLALGVVQPATGWLADRFGRRSVFLGSLALFTLGSLLSGLAADLPQLVLARIVQGVGGGAIFPVGMAMVYEQFPPGRRGMAMGIWTLGIALAPGLGPTLGGVIVTELGWRWLFMVNVPIGIIGLVVGARVLTLQGFREARSFDALGFVLITIGLAAILVAVSEAHAWGLTAPPTVALLGLGFALLVAFVLQETRHPDPLIDLRMFAIPAFTLSMVLVGGMIAVNLARFVFIPLELVTVRGLSEIQVGLILTPVAFATALAAPLAGILSDRIGARPPVVVGLIALAIASVLLANLRLDTPLPVIAFLVALQGFGNGLALTPNNVAGMNALPQRFLARGTAIRSTTRQVAGSLSIALLTAFLLAQIGAIGPPADARAAEAVQGAYNSVFLVCAYITLGCLALAAAFSPRSDEMERNVEARAVEHERLVSRR